MIGLSTTKTALFIYKNPINLSHTMRKNKDISSYASTTDRGIHHGQIIVLAGS